MHPIRSKRLIWIVLIVLFMGSAVGLSLYALRQNIDLFYTPKQLLARHISSDHAIRVGGWVVSGSVSHATKQLGIRFVITDHEKNLAVYYEGILPDLFREGQAVVVEGTLDQQNILIAHEVLAKHDENYTPPDLRK